MCTRCVRRGRRRTDLVHKVTDRADGWQPDDRTAGQDSWTGRPDIPSACGFSLGTPGENPTVAGITAEVVGCALRIRGGNRPVRGISRQMAGDRGAVEVWGCRLARRPVPGARCPVLGAFEGLAVEVVGCALRIRGGNPPGQGEPLGWWVAGGDSWSATDQFTVDPSNAPSTEHRAPGGAALGGRPRPRPHLDQLPING